MSAQLKSDQPKSDQPLRGRRALITGSTGGLGLAVAQDLARAGCDLMLNGIEIAPDFEATCRALAREAGWRWAATWTDEKNWFSVHALKL